MASVIDWRRQRAATRFPRWRVGLVFRGCRMLSGLLDRAIRTFNDLFPPNTFFNLDFQVRGTLAVLLVGLACGAVGSLVVGNRMAFFSDALAHCAFAGVALGVLVALLAGVRNKDDFYAWI